MIGPGTKTKILSPAVKEVLVRDTGNGYVVVPGRIRASNGDQIQIVNETDSAWEVQVPARHGLNGDYEAGDPGHYYVIDVDAATPRGDFPYQVYLEDLARGRRDYAVGNSAPHVIIL